MMKCLLRFLFTAFGVFMSFAFIIYLCGPNAMPWYVQIIMSAAAVTIAFALEEQTGGR